MIMLLYSNINIIRDDEIEKYMKTLPKSLWHEILKYKYTHDRKSRLIARLMLYDTMKANGYEGLLNDWQRDSFNKPFITGWKPFSISHSGELVTLCYGEGYLGVDIERNLEVDYADIMKHFHPGEIKFICESTNAQLAFYEIWVKKESLLKAIGIGLINELHEFNCVDQSINYHGKTWFMHPLMLDSGYTSFICSSCEQPSIITKSFRV